MSRPISRRGPGVSFRTSATEIIQLPKSNFLRELVIRLTGALTLTALNNTVALTKRGDEWGVIRNLRLVANSSEVLFECSGNDLFMLNQVMIGTDPHVTVTLGDGATADPSFDSCLILPIWAYRSSRPSDTIFPTGAVNDLRLEVTWGTFTDINGSATAWATNPALEIQLEEIEPSGYKPPFFQRHVKSTKAIAAANQAERFNLDVGPAYRYLLVNTTNAAGDTDSPTIVTNFKLMAGSQILREYSAEMLRQSATLRGDAPFGTAQASTGILSRTNGRASSKNDRRAWYFLNLCLDGLMSEAVATNTFNELYLELTTSGAGAVNVIASQIFPNTK